MEKYIKTMEVTVKTLEVFAVIVLLIYGIICLERWQRPNELKEKTHYYVDTIKKT